MLVNSFDLVQAIGTEWAAGLEHFLETNTQGLIVLVGLSLMLEFIGIERTGEERRRLAGGVDEFYEAIVANESAGFLVERGLEKTVGAQAALPLTQGLRLDRPPLHDTVVRITVTPGSSITTAKSRSTATLTIEHRIDFDWTGGDVLLAIVSNNDDMNTVMTAMPQILETQLLKDISATDLATLGREVDWAERSPFKLIRGDGGVDPIPLRPVSIRQARKLCRGVGISPGNILILRGAAEGTGRLRITQTQTHSARINFAWWMADRLIDVTNLQVELSPPLGRRGNSEVVPFWSSTTSPAGRVGPGRWEYHNVGWLVPGQGVVIHWQSTNSGTRTGRGGREKT